MKLRVVSLAFFLGSVAVAVTWLSVFPVLLPLLDVRRALPGPADAALVERLPALLPYLLGADLILVSLVIGAIIWFVVARPLVQVERSVSQLDTRNLEFVPSRSGPLLARLQAALRQMTGALSEQRALTERHIADLRESNENLRRTQAELVASERLASVGRLAAGVAHEVGNPLSGILGYISLLRMRSSGDSNVRDFADRIEAEVRRIDTIVRGLLEMGRAPALQLQPVQLAPLVATHVRLLAAGAELKDVEVKVEVSENAVVFADPGPLSQVLINLLVNAGQAIGGRGTIWIRSESKGSKLVLAVEDSGPGIGPDVLPHLFEPFFTTKAPGKGTGLGLAMSLHLARVMGGDLRAANRTEGGARFAIELPVSPRA